MPFNFSGLVHQPPLLGVQPDTQRLLARLVRWQTLASHATAFYQPGRAVCTETWLQKLAAHLARVDRICERYQKNRRKGAASSDRRGLSGTRGQKAKEAHGLRPVGFFCLTSAL